MSLETQPVGHHGQAIPESPGVDPRRLAVAVGAALLLLGTGIGGLGLVYWREVPIKTLPPPQTFPQPRVQVDEPGELHQLLARQRQQLGQFRWADKEHTLVQIPIERAMNIIAGEGAHAYDPIAPSASAAASPGAAPERAMTPSAAAPQQSPSPPKTGTATEHSP